MPYRTEELGLKGQTSGTDEEKMVLTLKEELDVWGETNM